MNPTYGGLIYFSFSISFFVAELEPQHFPLPVVQGWNDIQADWSQNAVPANGSQNDARVDWSQGDIDNLEKHQFQYLLRLFSSFH
mmetsp:Transcript_5924/g.14844  ORF Transcript_5924/g.14844 Transcript_5924/m.14844 type:complete len:85 (-) Transcript_5924:95-349(-)